MKKIGNPSATIANGSLWVISIIFQIRELTQEITQWIFSGKRHFKLPTNAF